MVEGANSYTAPWLLQRNPSRAIALSAFALGLLALLNLSLVWRPIIEDGLAILASVLFVFGAWRSMATRQMLAELPAIVISVEPEDVEAEKSSRKQPDLISIGASNLEHQHGGEMLRHIAWERFYYLLGIALLLALLSASLWSHISG